MITEKERKKGDGNKKTTLIFSLIKRNQQKLSKKQRIEKTI